MNKKSNLLIVSLIIIAFICTVFNGYRGINSKVNKLEEIFYNGQDNELSLHHDLESINNCMSNSISLSEVYNINNSNYKKVSKLVKQFDNINKIKDYNKWYTNVKKTYPLLLSDLSECNLSSEHQKMLNKYKVIYNSALHTISYSNYNTLVNEYNQSTKGILASLYKKLTGGEVVSFD